MSSDSSTATGSEKSREAPVTREEGLTSRWPMQPASRDVRSVATRRCDAFSCARMVCTSSQHCDCCCRQLDSLITPSKSLASLRRLRAGLHSTSRAGQHGPLAAATNNSVSPADTKAPAAPASEPVSSQPHTELQTTQREQEGSRSGQQQSREISRPAHMLAVLGGLTRNVGTCDSVSGAVEVCVADLWRCDAVRGVCVHGVMCGV